MNYGKRGVKEIQRSLNSKTLKLWNALLLMALRVAILAGIGIIICGIALDRKSTRLNSSHQV